ncbi:MAG: lamin tail domain-containing protein [Planctomycetota bacterium]
MKKLFMAAALMVGLAGVCPAELVISEYMANPAALPDSEGEYFELYNSGAAAISFDTISDDGSDNFVFTTPISVAPGEFVVLGNTAQSYVDFVYTPYFLANGADEIVVSSGATELARVNYSNGDPFGAGVAVVLEDVFGSPLNYIAEVSTFSTGDIGSPGVAGSTITAIPEPSAVAVLALFGCGVAVRRSRRA